MSPAARSVAVFGAVSVGGMTLVAAALALAGVGVDDSAAGVAVFVAMWTPFLGRLAATRFADGAWRSPLSLRRWGSPRAAVIVWPLVLPLVVYGASYAVAWTQGWVEWDPAGGKWDSPGRVAANVSLRLAFGALFGTLSALGEELGWRGYLQPRLDDLGVRHSLAIVIALEIVWHVPMILAAGYLVDDSFALTVALFAGLKVVLTPIWTWGTYATASVWTAALFHSLHNTLSQSIYPPLFDASPLDLWTGELGLVPIALYGVVAVGGALALRRRGVTFSSLAADALARARAR